MWLWAISRMGGAPWRGTGWWGLQCPEGWNTRQQPSWLWPNFLVCLTLIWERKTWAGTLRRKVTASRCAGLTAQQGCPGQSCQHPSIASTQTHLRAAHERLAKAQQVPAGWLVPPSAVGSLKTMAKIPTGSAGAPSCPARASVAAPSGGVTPALSTPQHKCMPAVSVQSMKEVGQPKVTVTQHCPLQDPGFRHLEVVRLTTQAESFHNRCLSQGDLQL